VGGVGVVCDYILEELIDQFPALDEVGDIEAIALEGQTVWYVKQPDAETAILLLLYKKPTALDALTDVPTDIPLHLHRSTIVRYAAMLLFDLLEQDDSGQKPNTAAQKLFYEEVGLVKLKEYLAGRRRHLANSIWSV